MKLFTLTMLAIFFSFASFAQISPSSGTVCVGSSIYLNDSTSPGGSWSSSNVAIGSVGTTAFGAILTGVSSGVVTITYTVAGGPYYGTYTVNPTPGPIGGPTSYGVGCSVTLTDGTPGGVWSTSSYTGSASIIGATGVATGVSGGTVWIYYTLSGGCRAQTMDTVLGTGTSSIGGPSTVCVGSTIALSDSAGTGSGTWSSSNTAIATVGTSGVVTGVSAGTVTITLTFTGACGSVYSTHVVTVTTGSVGPVSGPATVTVGGSASYSSSPSGGSWTISPTSVATIDASGNVSGVSPGTATITYTAVSCGSTLSATKIVTVNSLDGISGNVNFSTAYYGQVKVWLIHYDAAAMTLNAVDSITGYVSGGSTYYYQFTGLATDSFRVKAAVPDSTSTTGFIPTYHSSFYYWHDANVIHHTSGTSDIHEDINMLYGSTVTGPGFISGSVLTGANRGTSGAVPVVGLHMVCMTSTGTIAQMAFTDALGAYSFSNLPYGTYTVFPDSLNYLTTPFVGITLSASAPTFNSGGFIQHTISGTITPGTTSFHNAPVTVSTVTTFPNPTSGKLSLVWNEKTDEQAQVTISDITGRQVYTTTILMTEGTGSTSINLSALNNGMYVINIKSASLNYNSKLEIQK